MLDRITNIILYTTSECNMACSYCLNDLNGIKQAPAEVPENYIQTLKDFFAKLTQPRLFLSFFGGEPLLRQDFCLKVIRALEHDKRIRFIFQTNGTLLDTVPAEIASHPQVGFTISLDGEKDRHDKYRVFKDGCGTWDKIVSNIKNWPYEMGKLSITVTHYHSETMETLNKVKLMQQLGIKQVHFGTVKEIEITQADLDSLYHGYMDLIDFLMTDPDLIVDTFYQHRVSDREAMQREYRAFKSNHYGNFNCRAGDKRVFVNTQGDLMPCSLITDDRFKLGNIISNTYNSKAKSFKAINDKCDECSLRYGGVFCSYRMMLNCGSPFYCSDMMRSICEMRSKIYERFFEEAKAHGWLDN
jgi:uncharacterized protein